MGMTSVDARRTARTWERIISSFALLLMLAAIVAMLRGNADWLGWIATGLLVIYAIREFMIGSENVAARIKVNAGKDGVKGEMSSETHPTGDDA